MFCLVSLCWNLIACFLLLWANMNCIYVLPLSLCFHHSSITIFLPLFLQFSANLLIYSFSSQSLLSSSTARKFTGLHSTSLKMLPLLCQMILNKRKVLAFLFSSHPLPPAEASRQNKSHNCLAQ